MNIFRCYNRFYCCHQRIFLYAISVNSYRKRSISYIAGQKICYVQKAL